MVTYKRVLMAVPYQYVNEATIRHGLEIAREYNAHLTLFGVVETIEKEYENWLTTKPPEDLQAAMQRQQEAALQQRVAALQADYPHIDYALAAGIPFVEIIHQVRAGNYDLLILDAVNHQPGHKRFMGSTAKHVLRKCPCPVLCIREHSPAKKIVAAVDLFADRAEVVALNRKVIQHAHALAQREGAQLHLVYAQQPIGEPMLSAWGVGSADLIDRMETELLEAANDRMQSLLQEESAADGELVKQVLVGNPRDALPLYVAENQIDVLVLGTVSRTGIKGFLIGNTAESILSQVECSVLALKPDGFVSTVE